MGYTSLVLVALCSPGDTVWKRECHNLALVINDGIHDMLALIERAGETTDICSRILRI